MLGQCDVAPPRDLRPYMSVFLAHCDKLRREQPDSIRDPSGRVQAIVLARFTFAFQDHGHPVTPSSVRIRPTDPRNACLPFAVRLTHLLPAPTLDGDKHNSDLLSGLDACFFVLTPMSGLPTMEARRDRMSATTWFSERRRCGTGSAAPPWLAAPRRWSKRVTE